MYYKRWNFNKIFALSCNRLRKIEYTECIYPENTYYLQTWLKEGVYSEPANCLKGDMLLYHAQRNRGNMDLSCCDCIPVVKQTAGMSSYISMHIHSSNIIGQNDQSYKKNWKTNWQSRMHGRHWIQDSKRR
jgi:hypothetical protein